jgi:hypothetical protein
MDDHKVKQPTKEQVRDWLYRETKLHRPPPSAEEINRQLGRYLIEKQKQQRK